VNRFEFRLGDKVWAIIESIIDETHFVANIDGTFVSVENQSSETFKIAEKVQLYVDGVNPIKLKIARSHKRGHLDLNT